MEMFFLSQIHNGPFPFCLENKLVFYFLLHALQHRVNKMMALMLKEAPQFSFYDVRGRHKVGNEYCKKKEKKECQSLCN